ncbi:hypothetical protein DFH09DRAFT_1379090 [Mycena vulgaris]|nr:hypothetical protein DFH09DRAFT_1379090 [Mycena vulgaris]
MPVNAARHHLPPPPGDPCSETGRPSQNVANAEIAELLSASNTAQSNPALLRLTRSFSTPLRSVATFNPNSLRRRRNADTAEILTDVDPPNTGSAPPPPPLPFSPVPTLRPSATLRDSVADAWLHPTFPTPTRLVAPPHSEALPSHSRIPPDPNVASRPSPSRSEPGSACERRVRLRACAGTLRRSRRHIFDSHGDHTFTSACMPLMASTPLPTHCRLSYLIQLPFLRPAGPSCAARSTPHCRRSPRCCGARATLLVDAGIHHPSPLLSPARLYPIPTLAHHTLGKKNPIIHQTMYSPLARLQATTLVALHLPHHSVPVVYMLCTPAAYALHTPVDSPYSRFGTVRAANQFVRTSICRTPLRDTATKSGRPTILLSPLAQLTITLSDGVLDVARVVETVRNIIILCLTPFSFLAHASPRFLGCCPIHAIPRIRSASLRTFSPTMRRFRAAEIAPCLHHFRDDAGDRAHISKTDFLCQQRVHTVVHRARQHADTSPYAPSPSTAISLVRPPHATHSWFRPIPSSCPSASPPASTHVAPLTRATQPIAAAWYASSPAPTSSHCALSFVPQITIRIRLHAIRANARVSYALIDL